MRHAALIPLVFLVLAPSAAAAPGTSLHGSVSPTTVHFGDRFDYTVEVRSPRRGGEVHVVADSGVFDQVGVPSQQSSTQGGETVVRVTQTLACLVRGCVPEGQPRRVALPAPWASIGRRTVRGAPVVVRLQPRVPAAAVAARAANYRRQADVPAISSRLPLDEAAAAAIALAIALAASAIALVGVELRRRRRTTSGAATSRGGLELALRLLRESASRPVADRRRAADYVSRAVARGSTADHATRVAWSRPDPDVTGLADEVERTVGDGR